MRGRLVIAAAALTMALTPGVASATQDGDDQTTGSYSAEVPMGQGTEGAMAQGSQGAMAQGSQGTESQGSEATGPIGSGATGSAHSGATGSVGSDATASHGSEATASHEAAPHPGEGVPGYEVVTLPNENVPNFQRRTVYCPEGKKVIGGGAEARGDTAILVGSFPTDDARGWIGLGRQTTTDNVGISVFAICANV
ncbi:hypothetical protein [Streptomyces rugosispiralis]|uniref:Secreted protein n=1 Tax=Streptomyces rugosispiralis TaxID=2967341 RepID=A0ABT1V9K4_9ACTN|nr:hypothetical protein [Streptomyces rugosispiralis]MCQ8194072.1 hypothetical protein [Streptomyces rugosispiralis]